MRLPDGVEVKSLKRDGTTLTIELAVDEPVQVLAAGSDAVHEALATFREALSTYSVAVAARLATADVEPGEVLELAHQDAQERFRELAGTLGVS